MKVYDDLSILISEWRTTLTILLLGHQVICKILARSVFTHWTLLARISFIEPTNIIPRLSIQNASLMKKGI
jgi:hypothetical protein